ncbi:ROK family protein [Kineococcus rhizosphaerae]|uniref:ROK family protein n=1 Tax=Kineococcus rhizosphaerae TaxID=559628 RepID=UPI001FE7F6A2|nr:ROK family protein [Kineococcus rhizosphaerae]
MLTSTRTVRIGLDIGGTKIDAVALGAGGEVLATDRRPTPTGVLDVVSTASAVVTGLVGGLGGPVHLDGIGIGIPGLVDPVDGTVRNAVNLGLGPDPVDLADLLSTAVGGVPVVVENDVKATTWGAYTLLAPPGDLALLSLGTGLAAGLVVNGELLRGAGSAAGEIGHLALDPRGHVCNCGQRGCLETLAAGSALQRDWPHGDEGRSADHLFAAADAGDPRAGAVLERWLAGVALAVRTLGLTCDPSVIVLAGGVAGVGEPLHRSVSQALRRQARGSAFLTGLALDERLALLPTDRPVAAIGAAATAARTHPGAFTPGR